MKILVINSGSSSIKYKIFDMKGMKVLANGLIEKIGRDISRFRQRSGESGVDFTKELPIKDHTRGFSLMMEALLETSTIDHISDISAIGHRVVHGGKKFKAPVLIDNEVTATISRLIPLAPIHNPANLTGIEITMKLAPNIPQVAVFDTAFHQTMPEMAFLYALPRSLYEHYHVRRYGFHGTSHSYVSRLAASFLGIESRRLNCISMHLGNGASAAAIEKGRSIDTSMGMTPLEGLIMGTRSGDMDPAIIFYLARVANMDIQEIDHLLNFDSGLLGICGENDMRLITKRAIEGDANARLAIDMFCHRLKKYIGAYLAILRRVDCLIFTGGIGENSPLIRQQVCSGLEHLGIFIDAERNNKSSTGITAIHKEQSQVKILVIPTDEELEIAQQTKKILQERH